MKRFMVIVLLGVAAAAVATEAAETTAHGRVYSHWMMNTTETVMGYDEVVTGLPPETTYVPRTVDGYNEFQVSRAYVTVRSKLSERTSVRITSDIREKDGLYNIMLKYGYIDWVPQFGNDRLTLRIGLHPTMYIDVMNKVWNRRYLAKTVGDENSFLTTSDLGASAIVAMGADKKLGTISVSIYNGTKYSDTRELNKQKDFNFYGELYPLQHNKDLGKSTILAQAYLGTQNKDTSPLNTSPSDWKKQLISVGGALVYRSVFDLGFDVNFLTLGTGPGGGDQKQSGMSVFGTIYLSDLSESAALRTLNVFGRVDMLDPDTDVDKNANTMMIAGVECAPVKGFKASVNYRNTSYEDDSTESHGALYLNTMFKF